MSEKLMNKLKQEVEENERIVGALRNLTSKLKKDLKSLDKALDKESDEWSKMYIRGKIIKTKTTIDNLRDILVGVR